MDILPGGYRQQKKNLEQLHRHPHRRLIIGIFLVCGAITVIFGFLSAQVLHELSKNKILAERGTGVLRQMDSPTQRNPPAISVSTMSNQANPPLSAPLLPPRPLPSPPLSRPSSTRPLPVMPPMIPSSSEPSPFALNSPQSLPPSPLSPPPSRESRPLQPSFDILSSTPSLISLNQVAFASVQGNLGSPEVVTNGQSTDWLKDRWQIASDMNGTPLPLPQWIVIDLESIHFIHHIEIDWETAYAEDYCIQILPSIMDRLPEPTDETNWQNWYCVKDSSKNNSNDDKDKEIGLQFEKQNRKSSGKHVVHAINRLRGVSNDNVAGTRFVRLLIEKNATPWGSSVWAFNIYGWASQ